jgi:hypothetical protein
VNVEAMTIADLKPRRHEPPEGWEAETFERVTAAMAAALVAAYRRYDRADGQPEEREVAP